MATVKHPGLEQWLADAGNSVPGFVLCAGESYLVQKAVDGIKTSLNPGNSRGFHLETLDGRTTIMGDVIEQISTFSFFGEKKMVLVRQAPMFAVKAGAGEVSYSENDLKRLSDVVENGIPEGHFLVMTTQSLDRRRKIVKTLEKTGLIIDCTVPQGARKADMDDQRQVLQNMAGQILKQNGKTMAPAAFSELADRTGFNPALFAQNLEKLTAYTGNRPDITRTDVEAVILRDKKDPIFSLTNALMEKNTGDALMYLSSLLKDGFHELQILKAFENLVRRMLLVKAFMLDFSKNHPDIRMDRMNFNAFKQQIMPAIIAHDQAARDQAKTAVKDLVIAPNPNSPYPVFQTVEKSARFSLNEIRSALISLGDLDYALKSSSISAQAGIEQFVMTFCKKGGPHHAA
ncbi:DNA polymerase III subunit delta [Desulfotignum phosphitoxidans]|uniref:DNA polymerase III subunit delta n=1 Tax=Desulfotignum phosphitoxidans DSM 13687 TaxID=1286635 RepID=S0G1S3_9BACT|nr:DNA polymerase III subunit delta [Desulfotignum phosphitoxidans]EMS79429.1 DNA polymerase III, delta subunit HolA [Desulfotignum phosphitoxidans DSM 13687]